MHRSPDFADSKAMALAHQQSASNKGSMLQLMDL
jgi:hypothetical protein